MFCPGIMGLYYYILRIVIIFIIIIVLLKLYYIILHDNIGHIIIIYVNVWSAKTVRDVT
jgi:hypothetical protein